MLEASMDDIVKQAIAKWPNVPHCYGWLGLDARGGWRMRDEAAQQANGPGDRLTNPALVGFINRNYAHDERGCWFFQNGPQRVYVDLQATPFIARTDPAQGLLLQTGQALPSIDKAFLTETGEAIVQGGDVVALLDDRDVAQWLGAMECDGAPASDDALMRWLAGWTGELAVHYRNQRVLVERITSAELPARFGFVRKPVTS
jgi:hypothetical protein